MAGQRILDPLIGVRIPAPEPLLAEYREPMLGLLLEVHSVHFVDCVQLESNPCAGTEKYSVRNRIRRRGSTRGIQTSTAPQASRHDALAELRMVAASALGLLAADDDDGAREVLSGFLRSTR